MRQDIAGERRSLPRSFDPLASSRRFRFSMTHGTACAVGAGAVAAGVLLYVAGFLTAALWLDVPVPTMAAPDRVPDIGVSVPLQAERPVPVPPVVPDIGRERVAAPTYTVQLGAYRRRANAEALSERLRAQGVAAHLAEVGADGRTVYSVQVGGFASREAAQAARKRLAAELALTGFVVETSGAGAD